jgi:hypothetical protein
MRPEVTGIEKSIHANSATVTAAYPEYSPNNVSDPLIVRRNGRKKTVCLPFFAVIL